MMLAYRGARRAVESAGPVRLDETPVLGYHPSIPFLAWAPVQKSGGPVGAVPDARTRTRRAGAGPARAARHASPTCRPWARSRSAALAVFDEPDLTSAAPSSCGGATGSPSATSRREGWFTIDPPPDTFSWIEQAAIEAGDTDGTPRGCRVARPGPLGAARRQDAGPSPGDLAQGTAVRLLDRPPLLIGAAARGAPGWPSHRPRARSATSGPRAFAGADPSTETSRRARAAGGRRDPGSLPPPNDTPGPATTEGHRRDRPDRGQPPGGPAGAGRGMAAAAHPPALRGAAPARQRPGRRPRDPGAAGLVARHEEMARIRPDDPDHPGAEPPPRPPMSRCSAAGSPSSNGRATGPTRPRGWFSPRPADSRVREVFALIGPEGTTARLP